jgi:hypothetical protein
MLKYINIKYLIVTVLGLLNCSFRNPHKTQFQQSTAAISSEITERTVGSSEGPTLINNFDELCLVY